MTNADTAKVDAALDALLAEHDPTTEGYEEFRGHQFDAGLAWVQYPQGNGGLGVAPQLQQMKNRFIAKYDYDGKKCMELRQQWWQQGEKEKWTFLFYHDIKMPVYSFV